jgi:hypothetical protein
MFRGEGWCGCDTHFGIAHWRRSRYFTKEDAIRYWEEYQKDLEEELAEVAGRIERLKKSAPQEKAAPATA